MSAAAGGRPQVCVIGGGLAGIAAALRLLDSGARVRLFESRPELGGATYSFHRDGIPVDTGQHVFLRCFVEYRRLLRRLGTARYTELRRLSVPVLAPGRAAHQLTRRRLPAPAHLLPALAGYRLLSPAQRLSAIRAAAALRRVDPDDPATDQQSFGQWLTDHGQGPAAIVRLWELFSVAALNARSDACSLALAARVFRTGLLTAAGSGDIGRSLLPLRDLHGAAAQRLLRRLGGSVHTRERLRWLRPDPTAGADGAAGWRVGTGHGEFDCDAVVLAVPHRVASQVVPPAAAPCAQHWRRLGHVPIVNVHLRYAAAVTDLPVAAAVDSAAQWVFTNREPDGGQHLVVSLSAADELIDQPATALVTAQRAALARLLPATRHTAVRDAFVTRERYATFRQAPGSRAWRPPQATAVPGLALAGAWTDTGWPDTMEGAVRSGHAAADVIIGQFGSGSGIAHHIQLSRPTPTEAIR